jgi:hypothetical protein
MAEAVIFDDGGSTRIKQLKRGTTTGLMDNLLQSPNHNDNADGTFSKIKIRYLDDDGEPDPPISKNLNPNDVIVIHSGNLQQAKLDLTGSSNLFITLSSPVAGLEPLVHAKQNGDQRRYVVSNAGAITKVEHTRGTTTTVLFDITTAPHNNSVYTTVLLR